FPCRMMRARSAAVCSVADRRRRRCGACCGMSFDHDIAGLPTAAEDPSPPFAAEPINARARLMSELAITYSGLQYQYAQYRYDRLEDAAAYARLQLAAPSSDP